MPEAPLSGNRPETSLQLWSQLLQALRQSGFGQAGPEYFKLARLVQEARKQQLLSGKSLGSPDEWTRLSEVARDTRELLRPLFEASGILADLPSRVLPPTASPAPAPAPASASAPRQDDILHPPAPAPNEKASKPRATRSGASRKAAPPDPGKHRTRSRPVSKTQNKEK